MSSAEVAAKLDRVRGWLAGSGYGAALFTTQPGVAWVTGGLRGGGGHGRREQARLAGAAPDACSAGA